MTAMGFPRVCAIVSSGEVYCWGENGSYSPIHGAAVPSSRDPEIPDPTPTGITGAVQVGTGLFHSCALLVDGSVWCWGFGGDGQLGRSTPGGPRERGPGPTQIHLNGPAMRLSVGAMHSCALLADDSVRCWGVSEWILRPDGNSTGWIAGTGDPIHIGGPGAKFGSLLSAHVLHTCASTPGNRDVVCWGSNFFGWLGTGDTQEYDAPVPVAWPETP